MPPYALPPYLPTHPCSLRPAPLPSCRRPQQRPYGRSVRAALTRLADLVPRTKTSKRKHLADALLPALVDLLRDRNNLPLQVRVR